MNNIIGTFVLVVVVLSFCACGGGGHSENTVPSTSPPPPPPAPATMRGYLLNIKGVRYESCGGYKGYTGDGGAFSYARLINCAVSFSIGPMPLGSPAVIADPDDTIITPYDLRASTQPSDVVGTNVLTLSETLNARPNSRGVIEISAGTDQYAIDARWTPVDFTSNDFPSIASAVIQKPLVDSASAHSDYDPSVSCLHVGWLNGGTYGSVPGAPDVNGQPTEKTGTAFYTVINGVATPDGNVWLALLRTENPFSDDLASDYDRLSGKAIPTTTGIGFDAVGSKMSGHLFFKSAFKLYADIRLIGDDDWKGTLTAWQDQRDWQQRDSPPGQPASAAPNFYDMPKLKFAGRTADTYLLSLEVYADHGVRVFVNNAIANTYTPAGDQALLRGSIDDNDNVTASGTSTGPNQKERSFKLVGKIDRTKMIFTGYVVTWTPSAPNPVPYMEFTEAAPAAGCAVFPNLSG